MCAPETPPLLHRVGGRDIPNLTKVACEVGMQLNSMLSFVKLLVLKNEPVPEAIIELVRQL